MNGVTDERFGEKASMHNIGIVARNKSRVK